MKLCDVSIPHEVAADALHEIIKRNQSTIEKALNSNEDRVTVHLDSDKSLTKFQQALWEFRRGWITDDSDVSVVFGPPLLFLRRLTRDQDTTALPFGYLKLGEVVRGDTDDIELGQAMTWELQDTFDFGCRGSIYVSFGIRRY